MPRYANDQRRYPGTIVPPPGTTGVVDAEGAPVPHVLMCDTGTGLVVTSETDRHGFPLWDWVTGSPITAVSYRPAPLRLAGGTEVVHGLDADPDRRTVRTAVVDPGSTWNCPPSVWAGAAGKPVVDSAGGAFLSPVVVAASYSTPVVPAAEFGEPRMRAAVHSLVSLRNAVTVASTGLFAGDLPSRQGDEEADEPLVVIRTSDE